MTRQSKIDPPGGTHVRSACLAPCSPARSGRRSARRTAAGTGARTARAAVRTRRRRAAAPRRTPPATARRLRTVTVSLGRQAGRERAGRRLPVSFRSRRGRSQRSRPQARSAAPSAHSSSPANTSSAAGRAPASSGTCACAVVSPSPTCTHVPTVIRTDQRPHTHSEHLLGLQVYVLYRSGRLVHPVQPVALYVDAHA